MKNIRFLVFILTIATLVLSACGAAATPTAGSGKVEAMPVAFVGIVDSMAGDQWVINGTTVTVDPAVVRDGPFTVGDRVKVEGIVNPDGSLTVSRVEVASPEDASTLPAFGDTNTNDMNINDNANVNDNTNINDGNINDDNSNINDGNFNDDNSNGLNSNDDNSDDDNGNGVNSNDDNSDDDNGNGVNSNDDNSDDDNGNGVNSNDDSNSNDDDSGSNSNDDDHGNGGNDSGDDDGNSGNSNDD